jgi:hypothetical protein
MLKEDLKVVVENGTKGEMMANFGTHFAKNGDCTYLVALANKMLSCVKIWEENWKEVLKEYEEQATAQLIAEAKEKISAFASLPLEVRKALAEELNK